MDPAASASDSDLNLQILRRLDREVEEVLATAGHVCLYYMHVSTQQWTRKNVEGSLFLLKRRKAPRFQMMVLNKLATENYLETIHASFDYEVNAPYLMYTHGNAEIHGIWFYEQEDLNRVFAILNRIKSGLPKTDILPPTAAAPAAPETPETPAPVADTAFWDKKVEVQAGQQVPLKQGMMPPPAPEAQQPASAHALTSLLKQAHLKQQSQQPSTSPAPTPPAHPTQPRGNDLSPPLLAPSFFQSQASGPAAGGGGGGGLRRRRRLRAPSRARRMAMALRMGMGRLGRKTRCRSCSARLPRSCNRQAPSRCPPSTPTWFSWPKR